MINNYWELILKYFPPTEKAFQFFLPHAILVTSKALKIANKLKLNNDQLLFIESASMLHDIGICKVEAKDIGCFGKAEYIQHGILGAEILRLFNLEKEALVAERHIGIGLYKEDIIKKKLPLPIRDMFPVSIEEQIICYSDLFFSKNFGSLFKERSFSEVIENVSKFSAGHLHILKEWQEKFN